MTRKYRIGNPIETDSVVQDIEVTKGEIPFFKKDDEEGMLSLSMSKKDMVFGLGETVRGINKRGWIYTSFNADDPNHTEDKRSLYASQNFLVITSDDRSLGVYVDTPGRVTFDIGYSQQDQFVISFEDFDADIYLIEADESEASLSRSESLKNIVKEFRQLIGRSYIPPYWAFGFGQSRWSYYTEDEVREVADKYDELGIPLDMIYLDIDYMERYKDFTVDDKAFPNFPDFVNEMKNRGIHLVPIIDAGVKIEDGYDVYEEGVKEDFFVKKENGENLVAAVWPGQVHFPDFLNDKAREWFGNKYKVLLDQGIDGFWNDMNEPAIFYTQDHLKEVFDAIEDYKGKNLDIKSFFAFKDLVGSIDNNEADYKRFYHEYKGMKIRHDKVHNLFGYNMTRAAGEAFERLSPDKRILMFSRSSYIGMHRYGGIWCGDNKSWWSHLLLNIQQMPALSMCGFLYSGADVCGFGADTTEDLAIRWISFGIFTPLFRNHAAAGTRYQELYRFNSKDTFKKLIDLRYALIPYLYSEFMKAALNYEMLFKPLCFEYDDDRSREVEDQLLVGDSIMIAPVYKQNTTGRYVYLPEDMKMIRFRSYDDYDEEVLPKGDHYLRADLGEVLVFVRKGRVLPITEPANRTGALATDNLTYIGFEADAKSYDMYTDDGITRI
ncbi:TIM-barrel domain-containing protein [Butyrivibrio fibrisolvens]|uniref:glycoside hydrolase family 31 protein n=1 Tax=Butyrivibrio fibrisolvens TaxID=831 RepID=UPI00040D06D1|nr:TIM-barrel domain-containing protein [Butyrivibrio fibrisolvens]